MVFTGCNKDEDLTPIVEGDIPKIKTITYDDQETETYSYNEAGQVVKVLYDDNSYDVYEYSTGKVTAKYYDSDGITDPVDNEEYILNSKGLIESESYSWKKKRTKSYLSALDGSNYTYKYNADNYLIEENNSYINGVDIQTGKTTYTITSGNTSSYVSVYTYGDVIETHNNTKEFYTDKTNTIGEENFGFAFYGKQDNNLIKKETYTYEGYPDDVYNYEYEFDNKGRVSKLIVKDDTNNITDQITITYFD